jgi:hypothetical protein
MADLHVLAQYANKLSCDSRELQEQQLLGMNAAGVE